MKNVQTMFINSGKELQFRLCNRSPAQSGHKRGNHNGLLYTSKGVLSNPLYGDLRKSEDFVSANFKRRQLQFQSAVRQSGDISVAPFDQVGRTNFYRHGKFQ